MLALGLCLPDSLRIEGAVRPDELDPIHRLGRVQPICRPFPSDCVGLIREGDLLHSFPQKTEMDVDAQFQVSVVVVRFGWD